MVMRKLILRITVSLFMAVICLDSYGQDIKKARETFLRLTEMNYAPDDEVTETMIRLSGDGRANDVMLLQLYMDCRSNT